MKELIKVSIGNKYTTVSPGWLLSHSEEDIPELLVCGGCDLDGQTEPESLEPMCYGECIEEFLEENKNESVKLEVMSNVGIVFASKEHQEGNSNCECNECRYTRTMEEEAEKERYQELGGALEWLIKSGRHFYFNGDFENGIPMINYSDGVKKVL